MAKKKVTRTPARPNRLRIRMYCQGLGDCFLLTFPRNTARRKEFHVLVDCGVIVGQPNGADKVKQVARHLAKTTNNHIDVLVVTHEHWDHVSGFKDAEAEFSKIAFDQVWLSWMENPDEPRAVALQQERDAKKRKIALALDQAAPALAASDGEPGRAVAKSLQGLAGFLGLESGHAVESLSFEDTELDRGKTGAAMNFVKSRTENLWYLEPDSAPFGLPELKGVEFFVLGPPRDEVSIKKDKPTKRGDEVFRDALAAMELFEDPEQRSGHPTPFDSRHGTPLDQAQADPYFQTMYVDGTPAGDSQAWRRIDDLWMYAASELALQLDADTNNTSLVLAIRLPTNKVLLFPGDAQVGNWESWHSREYDWGAQKVTAEHLLNQTIVYKVGHHGSHNATLRDKGLLMMDDSDLVALLPVDESVAQTKNWLKMPFAPMLRELRSRTQGRILRSDHDIKHPATAPRSRDDVNWIASEELVEGTKKRSLYLDYFVSLK